MAPSCVDLNVILNNDRKSISNIYYLIITNSVDYTTQCCYIPTWLVKTLVWQETCLSAFNFTISHFFSSFLKK